MYRLSGRDVNLAAYAHLHQVAIVAHMTRGSELTLADLPPFTDGTVNFVGDSGVKRRCNITFETQTPSQKFLRLLDDDNARYKIYAGIDVLQPLGVYYLRDLAVDDTGQNKNYRMSLQDESALIAERKTNKAFTMSGDVINIAETILLTAGRSLNFAGIRFLGVTLTNYFVDIDKDPVAIVGQLLEGYGYEMIMSLVGDCIIRKIPGEPSNSLSTNIDNIVLGQQVVTARRGTNHIIVLSSVGGSSGQARGDAYDLDPKSPTYFNSSYGDVPETYTVNGLTSSAACEAAARAIAAKKFKRQATHAYPCIQIPKMDLGDGFTAHSYRYTADQISYSLVANRPMYLTGRGVHV